MQFLSVFPGVTKIVNFWWNNTDISRCQGVRHMIYISLESPLGKV